MYLSTYLFIDYNKISLLSSKNKTEERGNMFGEVILYSGKKMSGDLFLNSLVAILRRAIFENVS